MELHASSHFLYAANERVEILLLGSNFFSPPNDSCLGLT